MGPLIFPYLARFKVLDSTDQTQSSVFREPAARDELATPVEVLAQIRPRSLATLAMWAAGRDLEQDVFLFCHRRDLDRRGLIDSGTGMPTKPRIGDRLYEVRNSRGVLVVTVRNPPGAFVEAVVPSSFGPGGANALFELRLEARRSSR
jgi:hypothetical protein